MWNNACPVTPSGAGQASFRFFALKEMRKQIKVQTDQALIYAKVVELAKLLIANRSLHLLADEH